MAKKKAAKKKTAKTSSKAATSGRQKTSKAATSGRGGRASGGRKKSAKRELIDTGRDKRYVRRDDSGRFNESDDVGRSLSQDRRRKAKTASKAGQGDRGDRKR